MDDSRQELNNLNESLTRVSGNALSAINNLSQTFDAINSTFTKSMESMTQAAAMVDKLSRKMENMGKTGDRVKRSFSKTWVDVVSADILKKIEAEDKAFGRLADRVDRTTKRVEALKRSVKDGVINQDQLEQSMNLMEGMDAQLKAMLDTAKKINSEGLDVGARDSVRDINKLASELTVLQMQAVATSRALSGIDMDTDPLIAQFKEVSAAFKEQMSQMESEGATQAKRLEKIFTDSELGAKASPEDKQAWEAINKLAEQYGVSLEKAAKALQISRKSHESLAKFDSKRVEQTKKVADLELKAAKARTDKVGKGGLLNILDGFKSGGLMGGLSALGESRTNQTKAILDQETSSLNKVKLLKAAGINVTRDARSGEYMAQSSVSQVAGNLAKYGLKGLSHEEGGLGGIRFKDDGSIAKAMEGLSKGATEGGEALEGLSVGAEGVEAAGVGAEGALVGVGSGASAAAAALAPLAIAAAALMAIFKMYSAVMDHAAKNYREVRSFGGVSGILGQSGPGNLAENYRKFRTGLVQDGGGALDNYFLTFEKKMDMLKAAQASGLNAGRMQDEVRGDYYQKTDSGSMVGTYMQAAAHYAELFGKDLKEASAEMANLHEEVSMSFQSIDTFMMKISKSAIAAGVSNEKFLKITRSLANEQNNYGTSLQSTSRILQVLGQSGAYTSETLKKAFETLRGNEQSMSQRVFATHQVMGDPNARKAVQDSVDDQLKRDREQQQHLMKALEDKNTSDDRKEDIKKELNALGMSIPRLQAASEALAKGDTTNFAALIEDMPNQVKMQMTMSQMAKLPANEELGRLYKNGGSQDELLRAAAKNKFVNDLMTKALGLPSVMEMMNSQLQLLNGASNSMKKTLFGGGDQAGDSQRAFINANEGKLMEAFQAAGLSKDESKKALDEVRSGGNFENFIKKFYNKDKIDEKSFARMTNLSQKLVDLGLGSEKDLEDLKKDMGLSAQTATDTSEKIRKWMEPMLQTGNSWLDQIAGVMRFSNTKAYDDWKRSKDEREAKTEDLRVMKSAGARISDAQASTDSAQQGLVDLATKAGVDASSYLNAKSNTASLREAYNRTHTENSKNAYEEAQKKLAASEEGLSARILAKDPNLKAAVEQNRANIESAVKNEKYQRDEKSLIDQYRAMKSDSFYTNKEGVTNDDFFVKMVSDGLSSGSNEDRTTLKQLTDTGGMLKIKEDGGLALADDIDADKVQSGIKRLPLALQQRIGGVYQNGDVSLSGKGGAGSIVVHVNNYTTTNPNAVPNKPGK